MKRIWYFIIILFSLYSISILNDERYEVSYEFRKRNESDEFKERNSICIAVEGINFTRRSFKDNAFAIDQLKTKFINHLQKILEDDENNEVLCRVRNISIDLIRLDKFYVYNYHFCIIFSNYDESISFFYYFRFNSPIFFFFKNHPTELFFVKNSVPYYLNYLTIINSAYPYSKCDLKFSKFNCTNDCLVNSFRSLKYYYGPKEKNLIFFNNSNSPEVEKRCFEKCSFKDECTLTIFLLDKMNDERNITRVGQPKMSNFDYYIQLSGELIFK